MADVIVSRDNVTGQTIVELRKGSHKLKDMRLSPEEYRSLQKQVCPKRTNPSLEEAMNSGDGSYHA